MNITAEQVAAAQNHAARLREKADRLDAQDDGLWGGLTHGRGGRQPSVRQRDRATSLWGRQAAAERAARDAEACAQHLARAFAHQETEMPLGDVDWPNVVAVRTDMGWHKVLRVNRATVTVPSMVGGSWTDRINKNHVKEVR